MQKTLPVTAAREVAASIREFAREEVKPNGMVEMPQEMLVWLAEFIASQGKQLQAIAGLSRNLPSLSAQTGESEVHEA